MPFRVMMTIKAVRMIIIMIMIVMAITLMVRG